jgi:two-component system cell cycle response regulator DivK
MSKSILVVEDNPINMKLFKALLSVDGCYDVLQADTGFMGLDLARERRPDLIIVDIQLPGLSVST